MAKNEKRINDENEMAKLIKLVLIVTAIFLLFYVLTVFINKKSEEDNEKTNSVNIQTDEILIYDILKQKNYNYYVLVEDIDDEYVRVYSMYLSNYKTKEKALRVYTSVLNSAFNKKYFSTETNITNEISDIKFSETTLLEIKNGAIENSYQGEKLLKQLMLITDTKEESKEEAK